MFSSSSLPGASARKYIWVFAARVGGILGVVMGVLFRGQAWQPSLCNALTLARALRGAASKGALAGFCWALRPFALVKKKLISYPMLDVSMKSLSSFLKQRQLSNTAISLHRLAQRWMSSAETAASTS